MPAQFARIPNSGELQRAYQLLTDGTVSRWSGGKIPRFNPVQAAGFLGALTHEHGRWDWRNLDVIERGSGRGRGAIQATDNWDGSAGRRTGYEAARAAAVRQGINPNTVDFQMRYIAEEYAGRWDSAVGGRSLSGWTRVFNNMPNFNNVRDAVMYFTGSVEEGRGYLRPRRATAHYDRRIDAAQQIFGYTRQWNSPNSPNPRTPATPAAGRGNSRQQPSFVDRVLNNLGIRGNEQSFNMDRLQRNLGSIAANTPARDVGFAVFAAQEGGRRGRNAWRNLDSRTRRAYIRAGNQLAIIANDTSAATRAAGNSYGRRAMAINNNASSTYRSNPRLSISPSSSNRSSGSNINSDRSTRSSGAYSSRSAASWENSSYSWDRDRRSDYNSSFNTAANNLSVSSGGWSYSPSNAPGLAVGTVSGAGAPSYAGVNYSGGNPLSR